MENYKEIKFFINLFSYNTFFFFMKLESYTCVFISKINEILILIAEKSIREIPEFFKISRDTSNRDPGLPVSR